MLLIKLESKLVSNLNCIKHVTYRRKEALEAKAARAAGFFIVFVCVGITARHVGYGDITPQWKRNGCMSST